jgi:hypothetical protein
MDRKVEGWGDSLDKAWRVFFVRARRAMRNYEASKPVVIPGNVGELGEGEVEQFIPVDTSEPQSDGDGFVDVDAPVYPH